MKKLLAVVLAALMIFQSFAVIAAEPDVKVGPFEVKADIDLALMGGDAEDFKKEVEIDTKDSIKFEASIDMSSIRDEFDSSLELIDEYAESVYTDDVALYGDFELVLTFDSALKLADSVIDGSNLDGFSDEASILFREVKRTLNIGAKTTTLTIAIAVRDNVTAGVIDDNLKKYLANMEFVGEFASVAKAGEYAVKGEIDGYVGGYYVDDDDIEYEGTIIFTEKEVPTAYVIVTTATYTVTASVDADATATFNGAAVDVVDGEIVIEDVVPGFYNLVVTKNGLSKTVKVEVTDDDLDITVEFPAENIGSEVVTTEPVKDVVVDVEKATEAVIESVKESVGADITTTGKVIVETTVDSFLTSADDDAVIKGDNEDVKVEGLAAVETKAYVFNNVDDEMASDTVAVTDVKDNPIHLVIPYSTFGKTNVVLYSKVGDADPIAIDTFEIDEDNGLIHIYTEDATASFAIAYEEVKDIVSDSDDDDEFEEEDDNKGNGGGGGTGGNRFPGQHQTKPDGSFAGDTAIKALYNDVDASHWAYTYIEKMAREGVMNGVGNYTFDPEGPLTRAAVVKMLATLVKAEVAQTNLSFLDVPEAEWYNPYIAWGVENGIVTGYSATEFGPEDPIYRQDLAAMIVRFFDKYNVFLPVVKEKALFADDATIESYAYDYVYTLQCGGVLNGDENNMFHPLDATTRAEAAKVFSFIVDLYK